MSKEYEPELKNILSDDEDELKVTEVNTVVGCNKCTAGYINGTMCECFKKVVMLRKYGNANIDFDYASKILNEKEIDAKLKIEDEVIDIDINLFIEDFIDNAHNHRREGKGMIIGGPTGRGKSLTVMKTLMFLVDKGYKCYFITVKEFLDLIKQSWNDEEKKTLLNYIYKADFVAFDDLGVEFHKKDSDWAVTELDGFFRHRYYKKLSTLITTNSNLDMLTEKYAQRIVSLFHERSLQLAIVSKEDYRPKIGNKLPEYMNLNKFKKGGN